MIKQIYITIKNKTFEKGDYIPTISITLIKGLLFEDSLELDGYGHWKKIKKKFINTTEAVVDIYEKTDSILNRNMIIGIYQQDNKYFEYFVLHYLEDVKIYDGVFLDEKLVKKYFI